MKEYKFRLFEMGEMEYFTFDDVFYNRVVVNNGVTEAPVMQYTGIKDKNGKEIYEGDILEHRYVVSYVDGSDGANLGMNVGFYEQRDNFESWSELVVGREYEVLGNINENPELLLK